MCNLKPGLVTKFGGLCCSLLMCYCSLLICYRSPLIAHVLTSLMLHQWRPHSCAHASTSSLFAQGEWHVAPFVFVFHPK
jgi:hypothetical protein